MPTVLWFRRDLRLYDLPSLLAAAAADDEVLACFVLDPRLEASSGPRRLQFLGDCLRQLRDDLRGRLLVTRGRPEERIPLVANDIGASAVHVSEDFAPFGRRRDERVRVALGDVPLVATGSPYLVSPGRVLKSDGTPTKCLPRFSEAGATTVGGYLRDPATRRRAGLIQQTCRRKRLTLLMPPTPLPGLIFRPVRQRRPAIGKSLLTAGWAAMPTTATGQTATGSAGCQHT